MSENAQRQMTPEERHWATRIRAAVVPTVGDGDQEDVPSLAVAIAARIATLESQLEQARAALEKAAITMNHARTFITSRQKMHATGVALYDELLFALQALREGVDHA